MDQLAQGVAHHRAGRLGEAMRLYRTVLAASPFQFDAIYFLGIATAQSGDIAGASDLLARACAINPDHADAQFQYANTLMDLGRPVEAAEAYARATRIEPRLVSAHHGLARAFDALDRLDQAIAAYRRALALRPDLAPATYHLGNALMRRGDREAAIAAFRQAIAHKPDHARAHANLAAALEIAGRPDEALEPWRAAVGLDPSRESNWSGLARCLEGARFTQADPALAPDLRRCLTHPAVDPQVVAAAVVCYLSAEPRFKALLGGADDAAFEPDGPLGDPLPLALLDQALIADPDWERVLTALRRRLLERDRPAAEPLLPFACALAQQCFATEYAYAIAPDEDARVSALAATIDTALAQDSDISAMALAVLAAYRPLHRLGQAKRLAERRWPEPLERVIERQVREPAEEQMLAEAIPRLTPIDDAVSRAVQEQYEESPYPRWLRASSPGPARPLDDVVRALFPALAIEALPRSSPEMLIAGCGTGRQALGSTMRFAGMRVLAIDLSRPSLAFALRKTREHGEHSIEYAQGDLLALGALERRFDLIECGGVLHHLRDPMAGWRVLEGLLQPGGYMRIGLYSARARRAVVEARDFIAARGFRATPEDIRRCRQAILAMSDDGFARRLRRNPEFYALSACRDLLFHVQEHRLTLPEIADMLAALGLSFLGFEPLPPAAAAEYRARFPEDAAMTDLLRWDAFEQDHPDIFAGMYQFWVRKPPRRSD